MATKPKIEKKTEQKKLFKCTRDDAFASLLISVIYARRPSLKGFYRIKFNDARRSNKAFDVHRLVTDDTEDMTRAQVEKELQIVESEAVNVFEELRVM